METECIKMQLVDEDARRKVMEGAGRIIRDGGLVAFPTETVYGLGADAMNGDAAARIYLAKGRPSDNPLIVHIADFDQVEKLAVSVPEEARKMMKAFWPGPLTVILRKRPEVPDGTTGGLPTVAIRMPSHPLALDLIRFSGRMIAAPSANRSGRPSPTTADHVYEDMKGRIPLILDGGPVRIGIESTIVDMTEDRPLVLRPGYIHSDELSRACGEEVRLDPAVASGTMKEDMPARAPGMKYRHYAPKGQMVLIEGPSASVISYINRHSATDRKAGHRVGVIAAADTFGAYEADAVLSAGCREDPESIAAGLYRVLREMDTLRCDRIYSEVFYDDVLGEAIMNRLLKAAGYRLIRV